MNQPQAQTAPKKTERLEIVLAMLLRRRADELAMTVTADQRVGEKELRG
jgi:hypothetical protein